MGRCRYSSATSRLAWAIACDQNLYEELNTYSTDVVVAVGLLVLEYLNVASLPSSYLYNAGDGVSLIASPQRWWVLGAHVIRIELGLGGHHMPLRSLRDCVHLRAVGTEEDRVVRGTRRY